MRGAGQTPHGARPNREGVAPKALCVPARCAKPSGRSLELFSDEWPRGMTVTAATPYRIRLIDLISLAGLPIRKNVKALSCPYAIAPTAKPGRTVLKFCHGDYGTFAGRSGTTCQSWP